MLASDPRLLSLRDSLPGQVLRGTLGARYHLRELVGEGGQGWVFSAGWDEPGGYAVVVKVLRPDAVTPESLTRFEREAHVLRMLGQATRPNPHVVRFFDHATARIVSPGGGPIDLPFTVLEHVRGTTLARVLARTRGAGLALDRVRRIGRQVVLALEDVHAHKVVHRDLKPSNVLLANDEGQGEVAKVTDFGLVKLVEVGLGRTVALAGATLGYAPPEQFERGNRRVGPRTDVFSFTAMLYEMLTGTRAFPHGEGENPLVVVTRLLNGPRPSLHKRAGLPHELAMRADLVEQLDALIVQGTAAEPGERHASIGELWASCEPLLRAASERPAAPAGTSATVAGGTTTVADTPTTVDLPTPPMRGDPGPWQPLPAVDPSRPPYRPSPRVSQADGAPVDPSGWSWHLRVPPVRAGAVRSAVLVPSGDVSVAVGEAGLIVWQSAGSPGWVSLSAWEIDHRKVVGLAWLAPGELVAFGAGGLAARLVAGAAAETWAVPDAEVTFLGAFADSPGTTVTLVGERPPRRAPRPGRGGGGSGGTIGVIAQFARGKLTVLSDVSACARLRAVTRLRAGSLVACGDKGSLVRFELGAPSHVGSICGGHLYAIAALGDGGAVTVGAGGHALSLSPRLDAQLEPVQTTRDVRALAVDPGGIAWAGSAQARILRRTGGGWVRMSAELGLSSTVVALWASAQTVRAICDDGAIIEGSAQG
jgi:eukaryotic-like serine/threonine-protein kinase